MKTIYIVCIIAMIVAMMATPAMAETIYVNDTGWWIEGGAFNAVVPSLWTNVGTGAMNNVNDGDTVFVYNGTYQLTNGLSFIEPNVTLIGEGAVTLDGVVYASIDMGGVNVGDASPGSVLDGFTMVNSGAMSFITVIGILILILSTVAIIIYVELGERRVPLFVRQVVQQLGQTGDDLAAT